MHKLLLTIALILSTFAILKAELTTSMTLSMLFVTDDSTALKKYCVVYKMAENPFVEEIIKGIKVISKANK